MSVKVLFVCLGNICRSPMAEAVFQKMVDDAAFAQQNHPPVNTDQLAHPEREED